MATQRNDLSPWVHPKAKNWFSVLFKRSNLLMAIEDELSQPNDQLNIHIVRMALAFAATLGRPEIWPEKDKAILKLIVNKARQFCREPPQSVAGKPLTVAEHQVHQKLAQAMESEIEIVKRRLGTSVRTNPIATPPTWNPFWE